MELRLEWQLLLMDLMAVLLPEGYEWLVDVYDEMDGTIKYDRMQTVLDRLKDVSDVQIVTMHWGVEYENTQMRNRWRSLNSCTKMVLKQLSELILTSFSQLKCLLVMIRQL